MVVENELRGLIRRFWEFKIGDMPKNDIEAEIFAELDLLASNLYGQLTNKKEYPPFDLKYPKECVVRIKKYIKQRGEKNFKKNRIISEWYELCLEAVKLMENLNNQTETK